MNRLNIALTRRGRHFIFCFSPNGIFCNSIDRPKGFRCCS